MIGLTAVCCEAAAVLLLAVAAVLVEELLLAEELAAEEELLPEEVLAFAAVEPEVFEEEELAAEEPEVFEEDEELEAVEVVLAVWAAAVFVSVSALAVDFALSDFLAAVCVPLAAAITEEGTLPIRAPSLLKLYFLPWTVTEPVAAAPLAVR